MLVTAQGLAVAAAPEALDESPLAAGRLALIEALEEERDGLILDLVAERVRSSRLRTKLAEVRAALHREELRREIVEDEED